MFPSPEILFQVEQNGVRTTLASCETVIPHVFSSDNPCLVEELPDVFRVNQGVRGNDYVMPINNMAFSLGPVTYKGFEGLLNDVDEGVTVDLKKSGVWDRVHKVLGKQKRDVSLQFAWVWYQRCV